MTERRFPPGAVPHALKLLGKGIHAAGVAVERVEVQKCIKCGKRAISKGPAGVAKMCATCGKESLGMVLDLFGEDEDEEPGE